MSPDKIREAALPKSLRGFDETATRKFLADVADTVHQLVEERDRLRDLLDKAKEYPDVGAADPASLGNVLLAAQRAGEKLLADARTAAGQITAAAAEASERRLEDARRSIADADRELETRRAAYDREHARRRDEVEELRANLEAQREGIVAEARAEADRVAAERHEHLDALRREAQELGTLIAERRNQFVDMLHSALDHVAPDIGEPEHELATVLKSRVTDAGGAAPPRA